MSFEEVAGYCGSSKRTISRRIDDDGFPVPIPFGPGPKSARKLFRRAEVEAYFARKLSERDGKGGD